MPSLLAALLWYLALLAFGLLVLPLTVYLCRRLPDRGYGVSRPLGLLIVGWLVWALGMLGLLGSTGVTVAVLSVLVGVGLWIWNGRAALSAA